jgi:hypothetical protein
MIFLREIHRVIGARQAEFEHAYREGWASALVVSGAGRLLWYLDQAHGAGPSYTVVTITALVDGSAWQDLARSVQAGDLRDWAEHIDGLRHETAASLMLPLEWSPMRPSGIDELPGSLGHSGPPLYMEDTVWPHPGMLDEYVSAAGSMYAPGLRERGLLALTGAFRPAIGAGRGREVILLQRVVDAPRLVELLAGETAEGPPGAGSWMRTALRYRDRWTSRLLRAAPWSPLQ